MEIFGLEWKTTEAWRERDGKVRLKGKEFNLEPDAHLFFNTKTYHIQKKILMKKWMMSLATLYCEKASNQFIATWADLQQYVDPRSDLPKNMNKKEFLETFDLQPEWHAWLTEYEQSSKNNGSMGSFFNPDVNPVLNPRGSSDCQ